MYNVQTGGKLSGWKKGGRGIVRGGKKTRGELSRYLIINLSCLEQPETEL